MSTQEIIELRERIARIETRLEILEKRVENIKLPKRTIHIPATSTNKITQSKQNTQTTPHSTLSISALHHSILTHQAILSDETLL